MALQRDPIMDSMQSVSNLKFKESSFPQEILNTTI